MTPRSVRLSFLFILVNRSNFSNTLPQVLITAVLLAGTQEHARDRGLILKIQILKRLIARLCDGTRRFHSHLVLVSDFERRRNLRRLTETVDRRSHLLQWHYVLRLLHHVFLEGDALHGHVVRGTAGFSQGLLAIRAWLLVLGCETGLRGH